MPWLLAPLFDILKSVLFWLFDQIKALALFVFDPLLTLLAGLSIYLTPAIAVWTSLIYWVEVANAWVPIDVGLGLLAAYYTFLAIFVVSKFILKLIPGIG